MKTLSSRITIKAGYETKRSFLLDERRVEEFVNGRLRSITLFDARGNQMETYSGNDLKRLIMQVMRSTPRSAGKFRYWFVNRIMPEDRMLLLLRGIHRLELVDDHELLQATTTLLTGGVSGFVTP